MGPGRRRREERDLLHWQVDFQTGVSPKTPLFLAAEEEIHKEVAGDGTLWEDRPWEGPTVLILKE